MSDLVRSRGKKTEQCTHCAVLSARRNFGEAAPLSTQVTSNPNRPSSGPWHEISYILKVQRIFLVWGGGIIFFLCVSWLSPPKFSPFLEAALIHWGNQTVWPLSFMSGGPPFIHPVHQVHPLHPSTQQSMEKDPLPGTNLALCHSSQCSAMGNFFKEVHWNP